MHCKNGKYFDEFTDTSETELINSNDKNITCKMDYFHFFHTIVKNIPQKTYHLYGNMLLILVKMLIL